MSINASTCSGSRSPISSSCRADSPRSQPRFSSATTREKAFHFLNRTTGGSRSTVWPTSTSMAKASVTTWIAVSPGRSAHTPHASHDRPPLRITDATATRVPQPKRAPGPPSHSISGTNSKVPRAAPAKSAAYSLAVRSRYVWNRRAKTAPPPTNGSVHTPTAEPSASTAEPPVTCSSSSTGTRTQGKSGGRHAIATAGAARHPSHPPPEHPRTQVHPQTTGSPIPTELRRSRETRCGSSREPTARVSG